jgi:hypothetical protein
MSWFGVIRGSALIPLFMVGFILYPAWLSAQGFYFGRNKVQYTRFDWQVLKTTHFDIYYYPEMQDIAEKGAQFSEESFSVLETKFNYSVNHRIPLIFYSSHQHFQQTNVSPGFIPEGVGGFFEFIKGRVVVPSNGDIKQFRRVIRHELVHVFMHSKIAHVSSQYNSLETAYPPLWFVEGLAEFWSGGWDAQGEMVLRDAVLNNYVVGLEDMYQILGTFTMYKIGQDMLMYIAETYGEDKIVRLHESLWKYQYFEDCFRDVLGVTYKEFDKDYLYRLKKRFYPQLETNDFNYNIDETIVRDGYNFKPVYYREGGQDYVVFVGNRTGYSSIYMKCLEATPLKGSEHVETLIKGESTSDFEAFHIFDSRIAISKQAILAFTSKSGESDALYLYDIPQRKVIARHSFNGLVGILSPAWSPDGADIVFSGLHNNGYRDLYLFNIPTQTLTRLTDDFYDDTDPSFSPDGRMIAFSSDRSDYGPEGASNIFVLDRNNGAIQYLTFGIQQDQGAVFSPDGRYLAYTSDCDGTNNIYLIRNPLQQLESKRPAESLRMTHYIGATFDPAWTPDGSLLYSTFENMRFQVRRWTGLDQIESAERITTDITPLYEKPWTYANLSESKIEARKPYIRKYQLDFAQTQVSQDPIFGTTGGAQFAFTDVLGNDQYYLLIYNNARTSSDFWKSFNVAITKLSLENRTNYAYGIYRFAGYYYNPQDAYYYEERAGGFLTISYPLSHFTRVSFSQNLAYSDKDWFFDERRYAWLNSSFISWVHDNSIWGPTGPMDGQRFNITLGNTYDFTYSRVSYLTGLIDLRKYFRTSPRTAYAVRLLSLFNEGKESQQFYFGGSWDLRIHRRWSLHGKRIFLLSQEWRFPLIDALGLRFPFLSMGFSNVRGALFVDAGNAWNDHLEGLKGSYGLGIQFRFADVLVLRLDTGRKTDFKTLGGSTVSYFFFGWDF